MGKLWKPEEDRIVLQCLPYKNLQEQLKKAGFERTIRAITTRRINLKKQGYDVPHIKRNSTSYTKALSPEQCDKMEHFLKRLLKYSKQSKQAGIKLNVNEFITAYRNEFGGNMLTG